MKKRIGVVLILLLMGSFAAYALRPGTTGLPEVKVSANMKQNKPAQNPLADINAKAKRSKGGDRQSISELADDIFSQYGLLDSIPSVKASIKERLIKAEMNFQKKGGASVREEKIATMINELTTKLGGPEFMKTDAQQVRFLRVARMAQLPDLINQSQTRRKTHKSIHSELSPLEAMFIAMDLIYQKLNSDDFQMTPSEFRADINRRHLELSRRDRSSNSNESSSESVYQVKQSEPTSKASELREASKRAAGINRADFLKFANSALDTLGIAQ